MNFGYFDDSSREYVITNPKTPVRWVNYIGKLSFGGLVDQVGGAVICKSDPSLNRIVKYLSQLPASSFNGETLYIRVKSADGTTRAFSPFFVPTLDDYESYECHVGLGYSRFVTKFYGVQADITIFVPQDASVEIRDVKVTNESGEPLEIDVIPVVEYTHFDALKQLTNADWVPQTMQSRAHRDPDGHVVLTQCAFMKRGIAENYFTSNHIVSSFESDRKRFLGDNEFGTWQRPLSLRELELSNYEAQRGDNIGALMHHLGSIGAGETKRVITLLGQEASLDQATATIEKYRQEALVDEAFAQLKDAWNRYLSSLHVTTPDESMNTMLNIHNPRQCYITKNWSRYLSLYQLGFGCRGIGFRDSSQDVMGILSHAPDEGKEFIRLLLQFQLRDGHAMHQFNPLTMVGTMGDSVEYEDRPHYYSDDHLWIILAVCSYIKETGDAAFLDEVVPFYEKNSGANPIEAGTVLEHLGRGLAYTRNDAGSHGLPLLGFADWNDCVNLPKGAESVFTANLYGKALADMIDLMLFVGQDDQAKLYRSHYDDMRRIVNACAWDGEWYVRYFDHSGAPLGSKSNDHGKLYINSQSWAVISGFAPPERANFALESVNRYLNTSYGMKLSYPGFSAYDANKGGITTYPPGAKENGGIFLHTNPWVMIAEALMGNGSRAYQYYRQINPAARNNQIEVYECEPYCYPQNVLGNEHPQFGLARNSWLSGTSSWVFQAATQYILGVRPDYQGLRISPCIPPEWDGFTVTRKFRNATYLITVQNPRHVSKGISSMTVDGETIDGNVVPVFDDGKEHRVEVVLGRSPAKAWAVCSCFSQGSVEEA